MADPVSFLNLLEQSQQIEYLLNLPEVDEDEKAELEHIYRSLKTREESKFDAIIGVLKECDKYTDQIIDEIAELKGNLEHWKNKKSNIINIIKLAYENQLISSKPTGKKYQATIKKVKPRLIDNFDQWTEKEKNAFGLKKKTVVKRIVSDEIIKETEEDLPDKEQLRVAIEQNPGSAPDKAKLMRRVSLSYRRRKRIKKGV
jgi:hypothetical protein|tara:strand:+ start:4454 stop:5056 length:603 start_codon:yes stop_codon:yes gene_type:complete